MRFIIDCVRVVAAAGLIVFSAFAPATADRADDYMRNFMTRAHAPGAALAVIKDGKVVKAATYGLASIEWQQPVARSTLFWMDSVTKLFTAVGILQLAEHHKISLDDPLSKYLEGTPAAWKDVTLRHLLSYTSGIKDDYWQQYAGSMLIDYKDGDIYAYATKAPLVSAPGAQFSYNNESYYLLGLVIARATGAPTTRWLTDHVLRPSGMATARMYNAWAVVPKVVSNYAMKGGQVVRNRADIASDRGEAIASWGLFASLDDMIAFDRAFRSGKLISPADLALMWSNGRLAGGALSPSGLAFNGVSYVRGHRRAGKGGQAGTEYTVWPDDDLAVILLTNMDNSEWANWYNGAEIARFYDPRIQPMSALTLHPDTDAARTNRIVQAWRDVANGVSPSPLLTPALNASITPEIREQNKEHLPAIEHMQFLACEPASSADPSGAVQYCYYRAGGGGVTVDLGFGLDRDGRIASPQGQME